MIIQSNQIVLSSPFDLELSEWTNAVIEKAIGEDSFACLGNRMMHQTMQ